MSDDEAKQGWTSSPNQRGTFDIVWSCLLTVSLCCWSALCMNVPARGESPWTPWKRKLCFFMLTLLAPEFTGIVAMTQHASAARSVRDFKSLEKYQGYGEWTMRHAFLADMGGFMLKPRDGVAFPVDAKQIHWLIDNDYVMAEQVSSLSNVRDKNKINGFMRFIMALQITWFSINFLARLIEGLAVTAMELTTISLISCGLYILYFWRYKPADIGTSEILETESSIQEILAAIDDSSADRRFDATPLDSISRNEWIFSIIWSHTIHVSRRLRLLPQPDQGPLGRFSTVKTPFMERFGFQIGVIYLAATISLLVAGWNLSFPTTAEVIVWRVCTVMCFATAGIMEVITEIAMYMDPRLAGQSELSMSSSGRHNANRGTGLPEAEAPSQRFDSPRAAEKLTLWMWLRNPTASQDPQLALPLWYVVSVCFVAMAYIMARFCLFVEDVLELRFLPTSAYEVVDWGQYFPHLG